MSNPDIRRASLITKGEWDEQTKKAWCKHVVRLHARDSAEREMFEEMLGLNEDERMTTAASMTQGVRLP